MVLPCSAFLRLAPTCIISPHSKLCAAGRQAGTSAEVEKERGEGGQLAKLCVFTKVLRILKDQQFLFSKFHLVCIIEFSMTIFHQNNILSNYILSNNIFLVYIYISDLLSTSLFLTLTQLSISTVEQYIQAQLPLQISISEL